MDGKKKFFRSLFIFILGLVFGLVLAYFGSRYWRGRTTDTELRERLEQVSRDLQSAIESQREAERRASRLQSELQGIADQARFISEGTRRVEERAGNIAEQLDGAAFQSGELTDRINSASSSLEESRILVDELGTLVRSIQADR